ncbi:MAG: hypothetical protein A2X46_18425 [Lentisphaerae bacterium GWF2_57_35]|nr:MAG: hypothetical protein A2X46_18425 [Lentisphaerae bacterium GWF2_57_35]
MHDLSSNETIRLLSADDPTQQLGLALLGDSPERHAAQILEAMLQASAPARDRLGLFCRTRFPFLAPPCKAGRLIDANSFVVGDGMKQRENLFLHSVRVWLESHREKNPSVCFDLLKEHTALAAEYERIIEELLGATGLDAWRPYAANAQPDPVRQLGFAPTYRCNLSCPYCISASMPRDEAGWEDIRRLIHWCRQNDVRRLHLFGGEPTFHPNFTALLQEAEQAGLEVYFPSNLVMSPANLAFIQPPVVRTVTAHVRSPDSTRTGDTFWQTADTLQQKGVAVRVRYNLKNEDWSFLVDGLKRLNSRKLIFAGIEFPGCGTQRSEVEWLDHVACARRFVDYMLERNIKPVLAKPLPQCLVEQVGGAIPWDVFRGHCEVHQNRYMRNVHVRPDFKIALCNGDMNPARPSLWQFPDWAALQDYVEPRLRAWQKQPLWPKCRSCYYEFRGLCQGACLIAKDQELKS